MNEETCIRCGTNFPADQMSYTDAGLACLACYAHLDANEMVDRGKVAEKWSGVGLIAFGVVLLAIAGWLLVSYLDAGESVGGIRGRNVIYLAGAIGVGLGAIFFGIKSLLS